MNVFRVVIHYVGGSFSDYNISARDDTQARIKAINIDNKLYDDSKSKQPKIKYCTINLVARIDN